MPVSKESIAIEENWPTAFVESTMPDGIVPPVLVGVAVGDIAVLLLRTNQSGEYEMLGVSSLTSKLNVNVLEPPELLAYTVYVVITGNDAVGVP